MLLILYPQNFKGCINVNAVYCMEQSYVMFVFGNNMMYEYPA